MSGRLAGKTALITGAAQGIGRATALAWAKEGARVIAKDRNPDAFAGLDQADGIELATLDVTDGDAIDAAAAEHGALDILFNCAGWVAHGSILEASRDDWDQSFAINVTSMFQMIRAFLPAMREQGHGVIVNMASIASSEMGVPVRCAYGASKAAVIGLTKSVAADYVGDGIRCNAICPATVETPSLADRINATDDPEQARRDFIARQKMGRLAEPEEIAELATYLASDGASYVTGQTILIDGGMRM
jgi:NAD(P)-dependent dehydrogenase (short-subunit alcohol dehydrogenase family)